MTTLYLEGYIWGKEWDMHPEYVTYKDLVAVIKGMKSFKPNPQSNWSERLEQPNISDLICLKDQFFWIVRLPDFLLESVSKNIYQILGFASAHITLKFILSLIHKEDSPAVLLALKKMHEVIGEYYTYMAPLNTVFSMDFRMRKEDGAFIRLLNQSCLIARSPDNSWFKILSLNTDISQFKTSRKIQFECFTDEDIPVCFPDEELRKFSSIFTARECQIIHLLAKGKSSLEIGENLHISRHTVDTHRRNMLAKSHLCNTAELIAFSNEKGLL